MPESRLRKKGSFMAPAPKAGALRPNPSIDNWNLLVGFGILLVGFGMLTRWR